MRSSSGRVEYKRRSERSKGSSRHFLLRCLRELGHVTSRCFVIEEVAADWYIGTVSWRPKGRDW